MCATALAAAEGPPSPPIDARFFLLCMILSFNANLSTSYTPQSSTFSFDFGELLVQISIEDWKEGARRKLCCSIGDSPNLSSAFSADLSRPNI